MSFVSAVRRIAVRASLVLIVLTVLSALRPEKLAMAQQRGATQRVVQGRVEDKNGAGLKGAVVYLKDGRSASVKTAFADETGAYRFGQLTQNTDYEIWAAFEGKKSATRSISSFDTKNEFTILLKIDR